MKFTSKVFLLTNLHAAVVAFAPPPRRLSHHSSTTTTPTNFQPQHIQSSSQTTSTTTSLTLLPDPSSLDSTTILTSDLIDSLVSTVGSLALLGSVGFGVFSGMKDEEWDYEYKPGNEEAKERYGNVGDLALMEVSVEEVVATETTEAQKSFFNKDEEEAPAAVTPVKAPTPAPKKTAPKPKATAVTPVKAPKKTSDAVLKATEKAKDEVKKVGVKETKEKMSFKSSANADSSTTTTTTSTSDKTKEDTTTSEEAVQEVKKEKGTKRKLVKGATLIVAAGAVAVARNVVKAWLGRGML